jgi:peroxiredoxin Q/BCP
MSRTLRPFLAAALVALAPLTALAAQELKVGDPAPDFTVTWVTAAGTEAKPFTLSQHRGETVVLAFFPKARTRGCTTQMEAYRDRYANMFLGGRKVTLIGVSTDAPEELTAWAKDAKFPFHFAADTAKVVGKAYGAANITGFHKRHLYVIDPAGRISYIATPFNQMADVAYTDLGSAVAKSAGGK